jgi:integrase
MRIELRDKQIPKYRPKPKGRYEIPDLLAPGLRLVVFPSGARSWQWRGTVNGKKVKASFGVYPAVSLADARDRATAAKRKAIGGTDPTKAAALPVVDPEKIETITVDFALDEYDRLHIDGCAEATQAWLRRWLGMAREKWTGRLLRDIKKADVLAITNEVKLWRKKASFNACLKSLRMFFNWCSGNDWYEGNPTIGIKREKLKPRSRVLDFGELRIVWNAAVKLGGVYGAFARLLILTGCRAREVSDLTWPEVNGEYIHIPEHRIKTRTEGGHKVPLTPAMVAIFDALKKDHKTGFVVSTTKGRKPISPNMRAREILDAPLNEQWVLHDLRRSFASGLRELGVDRDIIKKCINHTEDDETATYVRSELKTMVKDAFEKWSTFVENGFEMKKAA